MALADHISKLMEPGYDAAEAIAENEAAHGYEVVRPGQADWLPLDDWRPKCVCSIDGMFARLVLIDAKRPGTGALTRLLAALKAQSLIPCVVDPTAELARTLQRRNWKCRPHGSTFEDREDRWFPI